MIDFNGSLPIDVIWDALRASLPPEDRHEEKVLREQDERRKEEWNQTENTKSKQSPLR